jgi:hypothetical protein
MIIINNQQKVVDQKLFDDFFDDACLFLMFVDCFSRWWLMIIDN